MDAQRKLAVVEFSADFMREKPDYAAELGNQALMGTVVEVLDQSGYWVKIKSPEPYTAWVNEMGLVQMSEEEIKDYLEAPKYICTASFTHIYSEPSEDSRIVSDFVLGDIVRIMYGVKTHSSGRHKGYEEGRAVLSRRFVGVVLPSGKTGYVPAKDVAVFYKWAKERKDKAESSGHRLQVSRSPLHVGRHVNQERGLQRAHPQCLFREWCASSTQRLPAGKGRKGCENIQG